MLPPKLRSIRDRLKGKSSLTAGERSLQAELNKLDSVLERVSKPRTSLDESTLANEIKEMFAVTSGPDGYCDWCGKKL